MTAEERARAYQVLGYTFNDPQLLKEALTHSSRADNRLQSNERMEFLGDSVLDLVICQALYQRFATYQEGELTRLKSAVVSRKACAEVSIRTGMVELLRLGKGFGGRDHIPHSLAANVYESIVASIYLDGGFEVAREFILRTMAEQLEAIARDGHQSNYKAILQQYAQQQWGAAPVYELLDEKGPEHSKCFEVGVVIDRRRYSGAWGPNKKMAEQKAALLALAELGLYDPQQVQEALADIHSGQIAEEE